MKSKIAEMVRTLGKTSAYHITGQYYLIKYLPSFEDNAIILIFIGEKTKIRRV